MLFHLPIVQTPARRQAGRRTWLLLCASQTTAPGFRDRFGFEPVVAEGELIDPTSATQEQQRAYFTHLTVVAFQRGYKPGWAAYRFRDVFGHWPRGFVREVRKEACA